MLVYFAPLFVGLAMRISGRQRWRRAAKTLMIIGAVTGVGAVAFVLLTIGTPHLVSPVCPPKP